MAALFFYFCLGTGYADPEERIQRLTVNKSDIKNCTTLKDLLQFRAEVTPDKQAYAYLKNGLNEDTTLTYHQLDQAALAMAVLLADRITPGDRALILYPSGVDFLIGFFGSLEAFYPAYGMAEATLMVSTGDLGFMKNGEVYFTGRLKDIVIINGPTAASAAAQTSDRCGT